MSAEKTDIIAEQKKTDEKYMKEAIRQAKKAYKHDETPIGCVIVHDGKIIGRGYNRRNTDKSPLAHAEITAIRKASRKLGDWRLEGVYALCYAGTLPDVCRSDCAVPGDQSGGRLYEPESGMRRIYPESSGYERI